MSDCQQTYQVDGVVTQIAGKDVKLICGATTLMASSMVAMLALSSAL